MKKRAKSKEEERSMEERPCSWSRESKWVKWGRVSLESCFLQHLLVLTSHLHLLVPAIKTRGKLNAANFLPHTHSVSFSHTHFLSSHAFPPNMNSSLTQEKKLLNHSMQLSNAAACCSSVVTRVGHLSVRSLSQSCFWSVRSCLFACQPRHSKG